MVQKQLVRILNVDITGEKPTYTALTKIKGVSYSFANAICNVLSLDKNKKIGELSDAEIKKAEDVIKNPSKFKIPSYLLNRRKDFDSGEDKHITSTDVNFVKDFDVKRLKTVKSYRGIRHALGLPVRGQSTEHHFRRGKTIGVRKKGVVAQMKEKEKK